MSRPNSDWFRDTTSALVYSLASAHAVSGVDALQPPFNDLTAFVLQQHSRMPDYLRIPMLIATLGFDSEAFARTGIPFHRHRPELRRGQVQAWKNARLGVQRDLIRYFESLVTLALYSRLNSDPPRLQPAHECSVNPADGAAASILWANELRCEIAIIGSGPGGSITAAHLAEAGRDVLMIEEGELWHADSCSPFSTGEMAQKYRNGGQTVAFGPSKIAYVEGRCVGGGSEINSGLYHRTPPDILESWRARFDVECIAESDMAPHFESCETDLSVGHLRVPIPPASMRLSAGAARLNWKCLEIPRWFKYEPDAIGGGTRQSMTRTFVPRFLKAGGRLLANTRAVKVTQDGTRWLIHATHHTSGCTRIVADAVFLCGGAVQSPALLLRSGIRRNIGASLRMHPTVKMVARFGDVVNSPGMGVPVHQVKEFAPRLSLGCSISNPGHLALGVIDHPEVYQHLHHSWTTMATYYAMITGEGHGTVRLLPGFRDPFVSYRLTQNDRRDLADGLRKLGMCLFEAGAVTVYPSIPNTPALREPADLDQLPTILDSRRTSLMTIHLFCSCPMGENRAKCATDSFGRVHGLRNLFVNDASLLCTAPGVNPQGTIMALARRNARHFLGKL